MDGVQAFMGMCQVLVFIGTGIPFLMWIHRANRNARGLGAEAMQFTPGWSVGWYFIPIACLWKPYQAMKEIWQASQNPGAWSSQPVGSVVGAWWGLWVLSNFLGQISFRLAMRGDTPAAGMAGELASLGNDAVDVVLCLVAIRLISSIYRMQSYWAAQPLNRR